MHTGKNLSGKPIYSITNGQKVGVVKDIYLSDDLSEVIGLHLGTEGIIKRKTLAIVRDNVAVLGIDAILTKNANVVIDDKDMSEIKGWLRLGKLQGREVDTPGGTKVGTIGDVIVDEDGMITGYLLGRVLVEGPIAEQRSISREVMIDPGDGDDAMTIDLSKAEGGATPETAEVVAQAVEAVDDRSFPLT
ncbi:MAG TPA: hypothetical protein G4N96_11445 [Chloroflexi bacterium]|nr:hypothetical protein [Chloroflexota bacterium]